MDVNHYTVVERQDVTKGHPVSLFADFWYDLKTEGSAVPWSAFKLAEHALVLPWVLLLDALPDDQYIYRICGSGCDLLFGQNMTNQPFGFHVKKSFYQSTLAEFAALKRGEGPFFYRGKLPIIGKEYIEVFRGAFGFAETSDNINKMFVIVAPISKGDKDRLMKSGKTEKIVSPD